MAYADFVKISDDHWIHMEEMDNGKPCFSSVVPMRDCALNQDELDMGGWKCLGCGRWFESIERITAEIEAEKGE